MSADALAVTLHGTAISLFGRGILLRGEPGAGKSSLALALIAGGAVLVADDQVRLTARGGQLLMSAPEPIAGLLEIRGVGILAYPYLIDVPLEIVVELGAEMTDRLPISEDVSLLPGYPIPMFRMASTDAFASIRIGVMLQSVARLV